METIHIPLPPAGHNSGNRDAAYDIMADDLARQGWCVIKDFFPEQLLQDLRARLDALQEEDALSRAGVGRGALNTEAPEIRRDLTHWLETTNTAELAFLDEMEVARQELNHRLLLGLFFYEAHFALYEPGAFYARHRDSFKGQKNRQISTVLYLNRDWTPEDGGLLALYPNDEDAMPFLAIAPEWGSFVLFLSEDIPHEVQPAHRPRASIAGWFRCNDPAALPPE